MMMTFSRTLAADLRSVALVRFVVRDLLAVVTLLGTVTTFKRLRSAGFSSSHKESFVDKSPSF
jgi:hypothetical protein